MIDWLNPAGLAPPRGFTHAVSSTAGTTVHLAGQTATDPAGVISAATVPAQFETALANLLTALAAAGGRPGHLVKLTVYTLDPAVYRTHARELGTIWRRLVGPRYPAMTLVGVSALWDPAALLEIDGIGVIVEDEA